MYSPYVLIFFNVSKKGRRVGYLQEASDGWSQTSLPGGVMGMGRVPGCLLGWGGLWGGEGTAQGRYFTIQYWKLELQNWAESKGTPWPCLLISNPGVMD